MSKRDATAEAEAILRRDAKRPVKPGSSCPECHKTTMTKEQDDEGNDTGNLVCPNHVNH